MRSTHYPHVVRASGGPLFGHILGCVAFVVIAIWLIAVTWTAVSEVWVMRGLAVVWAGIGLFAAWEAATVLTQRTVFDPSGVSVVSVWGQRRFARSDLDGWRWGGERAGLRSVELHKKDQRPAFRIWINKKSDDVVAHWFGDAIDLARKDTVAALEELKRDESFGHTADERLANADRESQWVRRIGLVVLAAVIWVCAFPRPYRIALSVAMAIPIATVIATLIRRDRWRLDRGGDTDFRPATGNWVVLAALALWVRAFYDWRLIDWGEAAAYAALFGVIAALAVAAMLGELAENRGKLVGWIIVAALYGYGAILPLNMWLDRSEPVAHRARVLELASEHVVVAAPALFGGRLDLEVSRSLVGDLAVNGDACLYLYEGAFGIRSFEVRACADAD